MSDWRIFQGNKEPHDEINRLPDPPTWRSFSKRGTIGKDEFVDAIGYDNSKTEERGKNFRVPQAEKSDIVNLVNAALYLRRPLLVTGKPGTGKTSLAYAVAYELSLGPVLMWPITARSTLQEGLYRYDAIARLQDAQVKSTGQVEQGSSDYQDIGRYVQLGPVGTALLPSKRPRVLLIDEVDKSDINLPNDLLNLFGYPCKFWDFILSLFKQIEQVKVRTYDGDDALVKVGRVRSYEFPFIILTSNGERDFPPAFLRRCLRLTIKEPDEEMLIDIVSEHLGETVLEQARPLIKQFLAKREDGDLATDQLLNAVYLVTREFSPETADQKKLTELLLKYLTSAEDR